MITRGGVERIFVRACANKGMTETGSPDMVVIDKKGDKWGVLLGGRAQVLAWGVTLNLTLY